MENNEYKERLRMFGFRLSCLLSEQKMAQVDLAKRLKLVPTSVNKYTTARCFPSVKRLIEIAKIFDVSVDYLLGFADDRNGICKNGNAENTEEKPGTFENRAKVRKLNSKTRRRSFRETRKQAANRVHLRGHNRG